MSDRELCRNCRGKGHVMDGKTAAILSTCLPVIGLAITIAECWDEDGVTRRLCGTCGGAGFISFDDEEDDDEDFEDDDDFDEDEDDEEDDE